jgi:hypothetical protein
MTVRDDLITGRSRYSGAQSGHYRDREEVNQTPCSMAR